MSSPASPTLPNPAVANGAFSTRSGLALLGIGAALFIALLWMIGTGNGFGDTNDGGGHAGGKGLNGFAALAQLAGNQGWEVSLGRNAAMLDEPGLLVLTPPADTPGKDINRIVQRHRHHGPVLVIAPKWLVTPVDPRSPGAQRGWVDLAGAEAPNWPGFLDRVAVELFHSAHGGVLHWRGAGIAGQMPNGSAVEAISGEDDAGRPLVPLVRIDNAGAITPGPTLAAYVTSSRAAGLAAMAIDGAGWSAPGQSDDGDLYPIVMVADPDLLDNYGLADPANVTLALRLLQGLSPGIPHAVTFDLTLDGLVHAPNLLTLAFTPPYLAATLGLILAALAAGWRSYCRLGTARVASRELAFGKTPLVANSGALILRARRLHLLGPPYVTACRERIARALALPRQADSVATDAAIDRALAARTPVQAGATGDLSHRFAQAAQNLQHARGQAAIVEAARALHDLERMLVQ